MTTPDTVRRRAMAAGLAAICLWGSLAALSVLAGPIPPFQMVAMTFAVGASIGIIRARYRGIGWAGLVHWPAKVWLLGIGGLFGYHALYFGALQLAPPAEANLVNYLWPLLIVLLSAPLAGERLGWTHLAGAGLGFAGVALLAFGRGLQFTESHALGYALALGCAFTWAIYSVLSRRFGETPTDAIAGFCAASGLLSLVCHLAFERTVWPASTTAWLAPRTGRRCVLFLGSRRQTRRHPRLGCGQLRDADSVDGDPDRLRPCRTDRRAAARGPARHRRRRTRLARALEALDARPPARRRQLEACEVEARRHGAADQRPVAERARRLPDPARHDDLRRLADVEVAAESQMPSGASVVAHREFERGAGIVMPDFVGIDAMPVRAFAGLEQEEDRGAGGAARASGAERLAKMPAFGMRLQSEAGNDLVGRRSDGQ